MSNRVEELEGKVKELQAAVNGLTEELVETKERLRQLEDASGVDVPTRAAKRRVADEDVDAEEASADDDETKSDEAEGTDDGEEEKPTDDIIVA